MAVRALTAQDCLDLIASNMVLAQHGLTQRLQKRISMAVESSLTKIEASYHFVLWFRGTDASLQYVWDCFSDHFAASKRPLTEVLLRWPSAAWLPDCVCCGCVHVRLLKLYAQMPCMMVGCSLSVVLTVISCKQPGQPAAAES